MAELLFKDPRDYMRFEYELRKARRPSYSMRAFSRDLNVSPSSLNDFLKGRVGMSRIRVDSIGKQLNWSELRKEHFLDLVQAQFDKDTGIRNAALMRVKIRLKDKSYGLSVDHFRVISDWYHLVIRQLCDLRDHLTANEISQELSIPPATAKVAVKRLLKLGLLNETDKGYKPTDSGSHFGDGPPSDAIVEFHTQILSLAQTALKEKSMKERESHSLIFSVRQEDIAKMNAELRQAIMQVANRYAHEEGRNTIQALSLQVFPIWKNQRENV